MKQVYILLSRTGTVPSKIIHFFTRKHFTHAAISLLPQTDSFYSYARRRLHNCLIAGLVRENVHTEVYKMFENGECALYSLEVSDESYQKISEKKLTVEKHLVMCRKSARRYCPRKIKNTSEKQYCNVNQLEFQYSLSANKLYDIACEYNGHKQTQHQCRILKKEGVR